MVMLNPAYVRDFALSSKLQIVSTEKYLRGTSAATAYWAVPVLYLATRIRI